MNRIPQFLEFNAQLMDSASTLRSIGDFTNPDVAHHASNYSLISPAQRIINHGFEIHNRPWRFKSLKLRAPSNTPARAIASRTIGAASGILGLSA